MGPGSEIQTSQRPSQYFHRQCYIATDADEKVLKQVVETVGDDSIVVSTDYPHSDGLSPHAIEEFVGLEGVTDKTKAEILWHNWPRDYNLGRILTAQAFRAATATSARASSAFGSAPTPAFMLSTRRSGRLVAGMTAGGGWIPRGPT